LPLIAQKLKDYKFNGVLIKPYSVLHLLSTIESVVEENNQFGDTSALIKHFYNN
jgi:hypothetical protein